MGKTTNIVFNFLDYRLYLLSVVLVFTSCQMVLAADYLVATCDGPEGYCFEGAQVTIKYNHGGNVVLPPLKDSGTYGGAPSVSLGYCPTNGDGMAGSGCRYINTGSITVEKLKQGGWTWSDYISTFTGTYVIPISTGSSSNTSYCIAAWVATHDRNLSGAAWLSFGESTLYTGQTTPCVGAAPPPPPPDLCYLNSGNPIEVDFGQTERSGIGTSRDGTSGISKPISATCLGTGLHTLNIRLSMTPTSWSNSQIATSNTVLGVALTHNGKEMRNNDSFDMPVQGSTTQSIGFSLLRNPSKATKDIATGVFNASATLIVTEP
ncbi:fimbrial protein [Serratia liquefaciens]|uniref:fimbrial protein n=1 Tax=Serratia liquefaciens TaxID=614 RepID=UPI00390592B3